MESVALYNFQATEKDELPFKKGDTLKVQGTPVSPPAGEGLDAVAPRGQSEPRVTPALSLWYAGRISRHLAEQRLLRLNRPGAFLIRDSESAPGEFSLSVSCGKHIQHFKVLRERNGKYFLWEEKFNSLNELVEFYRMTTISKEQQIFLWDEDQTQQVKRPRFVQAQLDFSAREGSQLSFLRGDIIEVLGCPEPGWWRGRICGRLGLFPRSHVHPIRQ
ncbi:GRAP protein, partial [Thryothorus ludovicianus]|nr:GRAP protein [Thryothorus ludovicianus]